MPTTSRHVFLSAAAGTPLPACIDGTPRQRTPIDFVLRQARAASGRVATVAAPRGRP